jgi:hypothetical protein
MLSKKAIQKVTKRTSVAEQSMVFSSSSSGDSGSKGAISELPEGWKEKVDKKSARIYYVHDGTSKRQWVRPVDESLTATNNASDGAGHEDRKREREKRRAKEKEKGKEKEKEKEREKEKGKRKDPTTDKDKKKSKVSSEHTIDLQQSASIDSIGDSPSLPADWTAKVDKKSGRTYYTHTITKERSWKHPSTVADGTGQGAEEENDKRKDKGKEKGKEKKEKKEKKADVEK